MRAHLSGDPEGERGGSPLRAGPRRQAPAGWRRPRAGEGGAAAPCSGQWGPECSDSRGTRFESYPRVTGSHWAAVTCVSGPVAASGGERPVRRRRGLGGDEGAWGRVTEAARGGVRMGLEAEPGCAGCAGLRETARECRGVHAAGSALPTQTFSARLCGEGSLPRIGGLGCRTPPRGERSRAWLPRPGRASWGLSRRSSCSRWLWALGPAAGRWRRHPRRGSPEEEVRGREAGLELASCASVRGARGTADAPSSGQTGRREPPQPPGLPLWSVQWRLTGKPAAE